MGVLTWKGATAKESLGSETVALVPEWAPNRSRPQRNAYHRYTVDRHLLETASEAAGLGHRTPRPDLLVMAALLHDMGRVRALPSRVDLYDDAAAR